MSNIAAIDRTGDYLRANADVGGGRLKVAARHVRAGYEASSGDVDIVQVESVKDQMHQKLLLIYDGDNELSRILFGKVEVEEWLSDHPEDRHWVITDFKLAPCEAHSASPSVAKFYQAVRGDSRPGHLSNWQEFMTLYFRELRQRILQWFATSNSKSVHYSEEYCLQLPIELTITVPALWDHETRSMYINAAYDAGFRNVRLLLEPLCAAALEAQKHLQDGYIKVSNARYAKTEGH